ncbi:MAG: hypothetical protein MJ241_04535 [Bacilli bacterium]|nr:hypothetical protein [Bacilli bacterium]
MNYSKTIREYCLKNPGMVFDMSYEREKHFSMVPYKTFCKILSRIEDEGILRTYSKGIYIINSDNTDVDPVIAFYAREDCGIIVGNELFYSLGLTKIRTKPIVIYTNAMETTTKNIGDDYRLERFDYPYMDLISDMIILLELIENREKIKDLDLEKFNDAMFEYARRYKDMDMRDALKCHRYTYSTIFTVDQLLTGLGIKNNFSEIARECYKYE